MSEQKYIYLIGTPLNDGYGSFARDKTAPRELDAYPTAAEATYAEAAGDIFVPGYFVGEESTVPMSGLPVQALSEQINALKIRQLSAEYYDGGGHYEPSMWLEWTPTVFAFEDVAPAKLDAFLKLHGRRHDRRVVGERQVYKVEIEE